MNTDDAAQIQQANATVTEVNQQMLQKMEDILQQMQQLANTTRRTFPRNNLRGNGTRQSGQPFTWHYCHSHGYGNHESQDCLKKNKVTRTMLQCRIQWEVV